MKREEEKEGDEGGGNRESEREVDEEGKNLEMIVRSNAGNGEDEKKRKKGDWSEEM